MAENNRKSYRIRTGVGSEAPTSINVNLNQTFDTVDVLSLEISQKNFYKMPSAGYGVIVGRVIANGGFGIPNAQVSVFIPYEIGSLVEDNGVLYRYSSPMSNDSEGVRYNLLPRHVDDVCHQDVGTFWEKEYLLDNKDVIQVFDKYYKYTATTNNGGDYFIYGVPVGSQTVHVDIDLSDIGVLSQRPRDMMYKGYNIEQFDSPNKFKKDKNLNSLSQIFSQDKVINVYPFWGDTSVDPTNGVITRCDISIDYKFEPTCVFIGSIVSDTGKRAISQRCVPDDEIGKMSELITGEGKIEMIRRTFDGKVEEFPIKGNNLIDGDGVWCYQIPMNLDYVTTDEFGDMVPTDNPEKGIPTRARVRFRISMNEIDTDEDARKRARFLVPNNPKLNSDYPDFYKTHEADYEFGTFTKDESYRDLFWNKVYTVKSYIPRLQKAKSMRRRVHTGIKNINHSAQNNPFPFNNLFVRLTFLYKFICTLMTIFCIVVYGLNTVLGAIGVALYWVAYVLDWIYDKVPNINPISILKNCWLEKASAKLLKVVENITIKLDNFCDDGNIDQPTYIPIGSLVSWLDWKKLFNDASLKIDLNCTKCDLDDYCHFPSSNTDNWDFNLRRLFNCIENQLVQDQECTSFNFNNDWVNGVLYAPLWYRKVKPKKKIFFGLFTRKAKDKWCDGTSTSMTNRLALCHTCAQKRKIASNNLEIEPIVKKTVSLTPASNLLDIARKSEDTCYGYKCHKKNISFIKLNKGLIIPKETMFGEYVYYYKSVEYDNSGLYNQINPNVKGDIKTLFATDIVLLGSLNECDVEGIPQFFKNLEGTTYNMPPDLVLMDYDSDEQLIKFADRVDDQNASNSTKAMNFGDYGLDKLPEDIDESDAVNANNGKIHTDKTGADWGNLGKDQMTQNYIATHYNADDDGANSNSFIYTSKISLDPVEMVEEPDFGGLFYGLTCWSVYTKPKSCVNLSRICEYGVSVDSSIEYPDYSTINGSSEYGANYEVLPPDGFISYDELYDLDGRAMFATMNGNNLRTKINPKNGYPVYDFMYLYPENFDGILKNLMQYGVDVVPSPQSGNHWLEKSSRDYIRFRYGRNKDDNKVIQFYNSTLSLGLLYEGDNKINKDRFPKFENSFYFYFGLKPGNTAIDKFRTLYYSDCEDSEGEKMVASIEYEANDWCTEVLDNGYLDTAQANGWLSIDATYVEKPYTVTIKNLTGDTDYDYFIGEYDDNGEIVRSITHPKIYVYGLYDATSPDGTQLSLESNDYVHVKIFKDVSTPEEENLFNGRYKIIISEENGDEFEQTIEYYKPYIQAKFDSAPFRVKNSELKYPLIPHTVSGDILVDTASLGGRYSENMSNRTPIGGFVKVSEISQEGSTDDLSFMIEVEPMFDVNSVNAPSILPGTVDITRNQTPDRTYGLTSSYTGSKMEYHYDEFNIGDHDIAIHRYDNTTMYECLRPDDPSPYCPYTYDCPQFVVNPNYNNWVTNGGRYDFRFGVPLGGKKYKVTTTMLCKKRSDYFPSRNSTYSIVTVPEPVDFKMYINGIDYELIKNFKLGWNIVDYGFPNQPDSYTSDGVNNAVGWCELDNIDGLEEIDETPETFENSSELNTIQAILTNTYGSATSKYNWTDEYTLKPDIDLVPIQSFETVPEFLQSGERFIKVLDEESGVYYFWLWDEEAAEYQIYIPVGQNSPVTTISLQEYYNGGDDEIKNSFITVVNNYIRLRKNLAQQAKDAFMISSGEAFDVSVTYNTYETPVKTLMYHSLDEEEGTSFETTLLDDSLNENVDYGITTSTIKGLILDENCEFIYENQTSGLANIGDKSFTPIGYNIFGNFIYKKPWLVSIYNAIKESIPLNSWNFAVTPVADIPTKLFGVHLVDKRLECVYNAWSPVANWPYYYNINIYDQEDFNEEPNFNVSQYMKYCNLPGLFAGFVLNGVPERYDNYTCTHFLIQKISEFVDVKINTLSINVNSGEIDESRIPVVRLINSRVGDNEYYSNYVINSYVQGGTTIRLEDESDVTVNNISIGSQHIVVDNSDMVFLLRDKTSEITVSFNDEVAAPEIEYGMNTDAGLYDYYDVLVTFDDGYYYTFYSNSPNPVYRKCYPQTPGEIFNKNRIIGFPNCGGWAAPTMSFMNNDFDFTENHNQFYTISTFDTSTTLYVVRISKDRQHRCISKTYDLTLMEYYIYNNQHFNQLQLVINLGYEKSSAFYYVKYYGYTIEFISPEGELSLRIEQKYGCYNDTTNQGISVVRNNENHCYVLLVVLNEFINVTNYSEYKDFLDTCEVYLIDVTGLRHKMKYTIPHQMKFEHTYYNLDNGQ